MSSPDHGDSESASALDVEAALANDPQSLDVDEPTESPDEEEWIKNVKEQLHAMCTKAFEHLTAALLRRAGYANVTVTGGGQGEADGGIDGHGVIENPYGAITLPLATSRIYFQCKCSQQKFGETTIRAFKGAMINRGGDKGYFVSLGTYSTQARDEATRGPVLVTLISGDHLAEQLRKHAVGFVPRAGGTDHNDENEFAIDQTFLDNLPKCHPKKGLCDRCNPASAAETK